MTSLGIEYFLFDKSNAYRHEKIRPKMYESAYQVILIGPMFIAIGLKFIFDILLQASVLKQGVSSLLLIHNKCSHTALIKARTKIKNDILFLNFIIILFFL